MATARSSMYSFMGLPLKMFFTTYAEEMAHMYKSEKVCFEKHCGGKIVAIFKNHKLAKLINKMK